MKAFIIAAMLGVAASQGADCAYAESDQDNVVRPRAEYRQVQQVHPLLQVERVAVDGSMKMYPTTTTSFGAFGFSNLTESAGGDTGRESL